MNVSTVMTEVIGIDHIYITVSDLGRSEAFYDRVMLETLGCDAVASVFMEFGFV